jgi:hypothetical protein
MSLTHENRLGDLAARVGVPATGESRVALAEGALGSESWVDGIGDGSS